jgi:hypothetical protein
VAAEEQQQETVVLVGHLRRRTGGVDDRRIGLGDLLLAPAGRLLGAQQVDHPPVADPDQPTPRVLRDTFLRPPAGGHQQGLLGRVLGRVEAAEAPYERAQDVRRLGPEQLFDLHLRRRSRRP